MNFSFNFFNSPDWRAQASKDKLTALCDKEPFGPCPREIFFYFFNWEMLPYVKSFTYLNLTISSCAYCRWHIFSLAVIYFFLIQGRCTFPFFPLDKSIDMTDSYWLGKSVCYNYQVSHWLEWIMIVFLKRNSILHINLMTWDVIKGFIDWLTRVDSSHPVYGQVPYGF
jgi:hypothetical protein